MKPLRLIQVSNDVENIISVEYFDDKPKDLEYISMRFYNMTKKSSLTRIEELVISALGSVGLVDTGNLSSYRWNEIELKPTSSRWILFRENKILRGSILTPFRDELVIKLKQYERSKLIRELIC